MAVLVFVVVNVANKPAYYICSGTKTPLGQPPQPIQHVGLEVEMTPMLDRLLFQSKNAGLLILEQIEVMDVKEGGDILTITEDGDFRGQFARIARHLDVSTGYRTVNAEYDLYCVETTLAPV